MGRIFTRESGPSSMKCSLGSPPFDCVIRGSTGGSACQALLRHLIQLYSSPEPATDQRIHPSTHMEALDLTRDRGELAPVTHELFSARRHRYQAAIQMGALVFILGVAIGLRVIGLNQTGYNTDEAVYAGQAAAIAQDPALKVIFPVFRAHPLLF